VTIQDRERHSHLIQEVETLGAKVKLFKEVDVIATILTCIDESDVDLFVGIGGAPEGVIGAVGIKALGGNIQAQLMPSNKMEIERCIKMGIEDPHKTLYLSDLVQSDEVALYASGIT